MYLRKNWLSYWLRKGLEDSRLRLEPDALLLPADSISVWLARTALSSSSLLSNRSVACLIFLSSDLKISPSVGASSNVGSLWFTNQDPTDFDICSSYRRKSESICLKKKTIRWRGTSPGSYLGECWKCEALWFGRWNFLKK